MLKILPRRRGPRPLGRLVLWLASWVSNRVAANRAAAAARRVNRANRCLRRRLLAFHEQRERMRENERRLHELLAEEREKNAALESKLALAEGDVLYLAAFQDRVIEHQKAEAAVYIARRLRAEQPREPME